MPGVTPDDLTPAAAVERLRRTRGDDLGPVVKPGPADGACRVCAGPILGRQGNAKTCIVHRGYTHPPNRSEMVELIKQYEGAIAQLRRAIVLFDAVEGGTR